MHAENILKDIEKNYSDEISELRMKNQLIWPIVRYSIRKCIYMKDSSSIRGIPKKAVINGNAIKQIKLLIMQLLMNKDYKKRDYEYTLLECADRRNSEFGDVYTYAIRKKLSNYNILLRPTLDLEFNNLVKNEGNIFYSIGLPYIMYAMYIAKNKFIKSSRNNKFINEICDKYGIENYYIYNDIAKYFVFYNYYKRLLDKLNIKKIFFYAGYNITNLALIKSANQKEISTIEIQHGNFTEDDYAYHFFHKTIDGFDDFFANTFLCFNSNFKKMLIKDNSYFCDKKIIEMGFPIMQMLKLDRIKADSKIKISVIPNYDFDDLFENLLDELFKLIKQNSNIKISIRPHPNRINKKLIDFIMKKYENQINVDTNIWSKSIVKYDYFIGESSTTLLEAEYIGKKVFLIDNLEARMFGKNMTNPIYIGNFSIDLFKPYEWNYETIYKKMKDIGIYI